MRQIRFANQLKLAILCMVLMVPGFRTALADPPAATGTSYQLFRDAEASAGRITSASYAMTGIAGEPSTSDSATSASFALRPGYKITGRLPDVTNTAPVLDNSTDMALSPVNEDTALSANTGTLISEIISSTGRDSITDPDSNAGEGIAVISAYTENGDWQYDPAGGKSFTSFPQPLDDEHALLLSDTARIRFMPDPDYNGEVSPGITFRAWDRTAGISGNTADASTNGGTTAFSTEIGTAGIIVRPVNDRPMFTADDPPGTDEDAGEQTVEGWITSFDPGPDDESGQTPAAYKVTNVSNSPLFAALPAITPDGTLRYTTAVNANGTSTFEVSVRDSGGVENGGTDTSARQTFTITVSPSDDPPVAYNDIYRVDENSVLTIAKPGVLENDTDPDGDSLEAAEVTGEPEHGVLALNPDGSFTYTPDANFSGSDTFTYKAGDGVLSSRRDAKAVILVGSVKYAPIAADDTYSTDENNTLIVNKKSGVLANDTDYDNDPLEAFRQSEPSHGKLLNFRPDGSFTYKPDPGFSGTDIFTYTANDGESSSAVAAVRITVTREGDDPMFVENSPVTVEMDEDAHPEPFRLTLHVTDPDKELVNWNISRKPEHGTADTIGIVGINSNKDISYIPYGHYYGKDSFEVQISDRQGVTDSITVNVIIRPANDAPIISEGESVAYSIGNGCEVSKAFTFTLHAVNVDIIDTHTWAIQSDPEHGTADVASDTGVVTYTPEPGHFGTDIFEVSVTDGVYTDTIPVTMTLMADLLLTDPGDVDGDKEVTLSDAVLTLQILTGTDSDDINLCADVNKDTRIGTPELLFILQTLAEIPPLPPVVARDDSILVNKNSLVKFTPGDLLENDTGDGDALVITGYTSPSHGKINDTRLASFRYIPDRGYTGNDSFTYDISDSNGNTSSATVYVTVNNQPRAWNDMGEEFTTENDTPLVITAESMLANDYDEDGDPLAITGYKERQPFHGTIEDNNDGTYTYTPEKDFIGADSFRYTVSDGKGGSRSALVTITVVESQ